MDDPAHVGMVDVSTSPYGAGPLEAIEEYESYNDPFDNLENLMKEQNAILQRIADSAEEQREKPRRTMIPIGATPFSTTVRYRVEELVISASGATTASLLVGASTQQQFIFANADSKRFPYITIIDRGVDIALSGSGGVVPTGYIIAYPE